MLTGFVFCKAAFVIEGRHSEEWKLDAHCGNRGMMCGPTECICTLMILLFKGCHLVRCSDRQRIRRWKCDKQLHHLGHRRSDHRCVGIKNHPDQRKVNVLGLGLLIYLCSAMGFTMAELLFRDKLTS